VIKRRYRSDVPIMVTSDSGFMAEDNKKGNRIMLQVSQVIGDTCKVVELWSRSNNPVPLPQNGFCIHNLITINSSTTIRNENSSSERTIRHY
jgi:hypothetical protein